MPTQKKNRRPGQNAPKPEDDHYVSEGGEQIAEDDYRRWIERGSEAFHALDPDFGTDSDEDQQDQFNDLLCALRHYAQARGFDFDYAIDNSANNYEAEKRPTVPGWIKKEDL